jgi:hypothetical protein
LAYMREEQGGSPTQWLAGGGARVAVTVRGFTYWRDIEPDGFANHNEAAALLRVNRETIWRWVQAGRLTNYTLDETLVVHLGELLRLRDQQRLREGKHGSADRG